MSSAIVRRDPATDRIERRDVRGEHRHPPDMPALASRPGAGHAGLNVPDRHAVDAEGIEHRQAQHRADALLGCATVGHHEEAAARDAWSSVLNRPPPGRSSGASSYGMHSAHGPHLAPVLAAPFLAPHVALDAAEQPAQCQLSVRLEQPVAADRRRAAHGLERVGAAMRLVPCAASTSMAIERNRSSIVTTPAASNACANCVIGSHLQANVRSPTCTRTPHPRRRPSGQGRAAPSRGHVRVRPQGHASPP